ncbi:proton-coupled folate transporter-like isoform X1 [Schistocerca piceifrons]|uniref:proton-coupled folate transporter-like isoform X1 n=1 Tax=Schistocerca piceifrons TaxID=274613 RepID=UPI001F5E3F27|nr:proton-coupled folate transporter-like isoform X1 [Schistocerca piceifrons]
MPSVETFCDSDATTAEVNTDKHDSDTISSSTEEHSSRLVYKPHNWQPFMKQSEDMPLIPGRSSIPLLAVEPAVFMTFLASALTSTVTQKLLLDRVCQKELGLSQDHCMSLNDTEKNMIQPQVANLLTAKALLENLVPAIMTVFIGPWSDRGGRLPLLMCPMIGYSITYIIYGALSMKKDLAPEYFLPASIPLGLSGGFISVLAGSNSYIADIFPEDKRSVRLGMLDACIYMSLLFGNAGVTPLFDASGYIGVYMTSAVICITSFLYVLCFVQESILKPMARNTQSCPHFCCFGELFQCGMVKDMMYTCFRWRPNNGRIIIFLIIAALVVTDVSIEGENIVYFLFTNKKFGWDIQEFSLFTSVVILARVIAMISGLHICSKIVGLSDTAVSAICYITKILGSLISAAAPNVGILYLGCAVGLFSGVSGPLNRTIIAKVVPGKDIGKIFSMTAAAEALTPLLAATIYSQIYSGTIAIFPSAFFLISAVIYSVSTVLMRVVLHFQNHPSSDYGPIPT